MGIRPREEEGDIVVWLLYSQKFYHTRKCDSMQSPDPYRASVWLLLRFVHRVDEQRLRRSEWSKNVTLKGLFPGLWDEMDTFHMI